MIQTVPVAMGISAQAAERVLRHLKAKRKALLRMTEALRAFLTAELDNDIETVEATLAAGNFPQAPSPVNSVEMLVKAQEEREQLTAQLEALDKLLPELPEVQANLIRATEIQRVKNAIEGADQWIATIQSKLEASREPL
jgi:hypothetical protein